MNNTRQITITNKKGVIPSKFGAVQKKVYILPSMNDCLMLLPKEIANHILSFTSAYIELYLINVARKKGIKFVIKVFYDELKIKRIKKLQTYYTSHSEIISKFIIETIQNKISMKQIEDVFEKRIWYEKTYLLNSKQERLIEYNINSTIGLNQIIKRTYMNHTYTEFTQYFVCIKKLAFQYYLLPIEIEKEYENKYVIIANYTLSYGIYPTTHILLNRTFEVYEYLQIKPFICKNRITNIYTLEPRLFIPTDKIDDVMLNFGYCKKDLLTYHQII
jgi:hypothetical protein